MFDTLLDKPQIEELAFQDLQKFRGLPSIALPAICLMDDYLTKDMNAFEWGSGMSTLFFARRVEQVISVEHDPGWFEKVDSALEYWGLEACTFLVAPDEGCDADYCSQQAGYESVNFRRYVEIIKIFKDDWFDLILVDGRARCTCLQIAQRKLKPGGLLVLDDSARMIYQWAVQKIEWPQLVFNGCIPYMRHGHTVQTTIWQKGIECQT
jgi:hypothetical protein